MDLELQYPEFRIKVGQTLKIRAPTGRGKTKFAIALTRKFIEDYGEHSRVLWITYRQILSLKGAEELADLQFVHYKSTGAFKKPRLVVQMESLFRWRCFDSTGIKPILIVLDEVSSFCGHLISSTMERNWVDFKNALNQIAGENNAVIAMDAFWTPASVKLITSVFKNPVTQLQCTPSSRTRTPVLITKAVHEFTSMILKDIADPEVKGVFLWAGAKKWLSRFLTFITSKSSLTYDQVLFIHGDSLVSEKRLAGVVPDDSWKNYRVVAVTPALTTGTSFTLDGWSVFVIGNPKIFSCAEMLVQASGRVRQPSKIVFTVLDWEKAAQTPLPTDRDGIKKLVASYKMSKFTHLRRYLGISILAAEDEAMIVRQMFDDPVSEVILLHLITLFKDYNAPFEHLEGALSEDLFSVSFMQELDDLGILAEEEPLNVDPGFYFLKGLDVCEIDNIDLTNSSDCLSASLDQCAGLDFLSYEVEPTNFELDEETQFCRLLPPGSATKFRPLETRALKNLMKGFTSLHLFGSAFSDPYTGRSIESIKYITQCGEPHMMYTEVYAQLFNKFVINVDCFERLWSVYSLSSEEPENLSLQLRYRLERESLQPVLTPCTDIENMIAVSVLRIIRFDYYYLTCPELVCTFEIIESFKALASSYCRALSPARLPLIKFLVTLSEVRIGTMVASEVIKVIGALVQAVCGVIGVPSPLGDLRKPKRSAPYYAAKTRENNIRRALISYCLCRRRYKAMDTWKFCPSTVIPTLYYRYWTEIPHVSTISYGTNADSLEYIESRLWTEPNKKLEDFIPYDKNDPFGWMEQKFKDDQALSTRLTKCYEYAPRESPAGPPSLFALGKIIMRQRYDDEYDWVLITHDPERIRAIESLHHNEINLSFCVINFKKEFYYMKR